MSLCVSAVSAGRDGSQKAEVDLSCSGLTELDLGADDVFMASSAPSPSRLPFSPHTVRLTSRGKRSVELESFVSSFSDCQDSGVCLQ